MASSTAGPIPHATSFNSPGDVVPLDLLGQPALFASPVMLQFFETVKRAAQSGATVLITGETGVGKELIARAIHSYSRRQARAWVDLSCAALPEHLLESELFGHERGAFSGADSAKPGLFELAHQGTIFLDEIGELDPRMQAKLLRVLDGVPYYRLGGLRKVATDVRVVAATNEDLERAVTERRFRRDLFHRLSHIRLHVPPLRDRVADIAPLAQFFLNRENPAIRLDASATARLEHHTWPGNVRELRNVIVQAAAFSTENVVLAQDLLVGGTHAHVALMDQGSPATRAGRLPNTSIESFQGSSLIATSSLPAGSKLDEMERQMIVRALALTGGHQIKAATQLGISRRTLSRKLKLYNATHSHLAS